MVVHMGQMGGGGGGLVSDLVLAIVYAPSCLDMIMTTVYAPSCLEILSPKAPTTTKNNALGNRQQAIDKRQ